MPHLTFVAVCHIAVAQDDYNDDFGYDSYYDGESYSYMDEYGYYADEDEAYYDYYGYYADDATGACTKAYSDSNMCQPD